MLVFGAFGFSIRVEALDYIADGFMYQVQGKSDAVSVFGDYGFSIRIGTHDCIAHVSVGKLQDISLCRNSARKHDTEEAVCQCSVVGTFQDTGLHTG